MQDDGDVHLKKKTFGERLNMWRQTLHCKKVFQRIVNSVQKGKDKSIHKKDLFIRDLKF